MPRNGALRCVSAQGARGTQPTSPPTPLPCPQALFTPLSVDWLSRVALGLGETQHSEAPREGEVGRKGISHERTFRWWGVALPGGGLHDVAMLAGPGSKAA